MKSLSLWEGFFARLFKKFKIGYIIQRKNWLELRNISDIKPTDTSLKETPNLEDLYLFYFDQENT
jgi:ABC-2 type transport system ATP-binding protein